MRCLVIITKHMSTKQLEHSYLLCLAYLNFDYHVDLVATDKRFAQLLKDPQLAKRWQALRLYGVETFYQLGLENPASSELTQLDYSGFDRLKNQADMLI